MPSVAVRVSEVWAQVSVLDATPAALLAMNVGEGTAVTAALAVAVLIHLFTEFRTSTVKLYGPADKPDTVVVFVEPDSITPLPHTKV